MAEIEKKMVLFLCTGNYYRSRFAEYLFNHVAVAEGLVWQADSRGLDVKKNRNPGPMYRPVMQTLERLGIVIPQPLRFPLSVVADDFQRAALIVALKEAEHRPLIEDRHPVWTEQVEFWDVHDVDEATPEEALPQIEQAVLGLIARLKSSNTAGPSPACFALYEDSYFTFRFAEDRFIPRFHLEGVSPGQAVRVYSADPQTLQTGVLLATGVVGTEGWVDLPQPIVVRAGEVFVVYTDAVTEG